MVDSRGPYKHIHFNFRLNETTGIVTLRALERAFSSMARESQESELIARITYRLRRKISALQVNQ